MDCRVQRTRYIMSGLSALAAALMLSATALAASNSVVPCDQISRNLKSLEVPVEALTIDAVEHSPTDRRAVDPNAIDAESHLTDAEVPILYLTPRVTNILRDVFGATTEDRPSDPSDMPKQPTYSPLADSEALAESIESADAVNETRDLPHYQRHMFRKDI